VYVLHRPPGYKSSEDSIVRTHARLLRQRLAEYFSTEGAAEATIIEVPKGHYLPTFRPRQSEPAPAPFPLPAEPLVSPASETAATPVMRRWDYWKSTPLGLALGVILVFV